MRRLKLKNRVRRSMTLRYTAYVTVFAVIVAAVVFIYYNLGQQNETYAETVGEVITPSNIGPGGVGRIDSTSSLVLWLDANSVEVKDGATINEWNDKSAYLHNFTTGKGAKFKQSVQNGNSAFKFDGKKHYFQSAYNPKISSSEFTIFVATQVQSSRGHKAVISNRDDPPGGATAGFILYSVPNSNQWQFWTGRSAGGWQSVNGPTPSSGWSGQTLKYQNGTDGKKIYNNGKLHSQATHSMTLNSKRPIRIGAGLNERTRPDYYYKGYVGEVIMYDQPLNEVQRILVENYLAAKYDYTLASHDFFDKAKTSNGGYNRDVAGIGRISSKDIHSDAQGTGIVRISNPTDLNDDEFLIWGHNGAVQEAIEITDVPKGVQARFAREWRVSEVNTSKQAVDVGAIDVMWEIKGLGNVVPEDLRLLIDTDNDSEFKDESPISGATFVSGNTYKFSGVDKISNNVRFTLGTINKAQTALPIELISFDAEIVDEGAELSWSTATEINNDYFTIERSQDGINYEEVMIVKGVGNSNVVNDYSEIDPAPLSGISYYRLKQTDFDGKFEYHTVVVVEYEKEVGQEEGVILMNAYPNPFRSTITLEYESLGSSEVTACITSSIGYVVKTKVIDISEGENAYTFNDVQELPTGIYYVYLMQDGETTNSLKLLKME